MSSAPGPTPTPNAGAEPFSHDGGPIGVVVSHGFTGSPQAIRPWAQALADAGHSVRAPLLTGHGTTWQDMNTTRWPQWYAVVDAAFRELREQCEQVFVAGLSMGGALVTRLAQDHGPRVAGIMLVNPAYRLDDVRLRALPVLQRLVPSLPGIADDIAKPGVSEGAYAKVPLRALHSQTQLWSQVVRDLPEVTQPLLLMRSRTDHVVPASSSALLLSRISSQDVTEIILEKSFHVATLDHDAPRIFEESVDFIQRLAH